MSYPNQSPDISVLSFNQEQYHKYYGSSIVYSIPTHPPDPESVPAVVYAFYPVLPLPEHNVTSVFTPLNRNPAQEQPALDTSSNNAIAFNTFMTSTPKHGNQQIYDNNDSFLVSETPSPNEGSEENQSLNLNPSLSNSFETEGEKPLARDSGYFGTDGCWYPSVESLPLHNNSSISDEYDNSMDNPELDSPKLNVIPPPKLVMPANLMNYYNYYQRLDLPSSTLGRPHLVHTFSKDGNMIVEDLWLAHMKLLFRNFPHAWLLSAAHSSKYFDDTWNSFKDLAKVRFYCQSCLDGWTSMFGVVVFFYAWNSATSCGEIWYQVSGQKCGKCNPYFFELPLWYPEEAQKVITNLYYDIASKIYGFRTPQHIRTRRLGQPINQHNKDLCQGCSHGLCKEDQSKLSSSGEAVNTEGVLQKSPVKQTDEKTNESSCDGPVAASCPCVQGNISEALTPVPLTYQYPLPQQKCVDISYPAVTPLPPQMAILYPYLNC